MIRELAAMKLSGFAILYAISSGLVSSLQVFGSSSSWASLLKVFSCVLRVESSEML